MSILAFDTETELIRPGFVAPRLVCLSFATEDTSGLCHQLGDVPYYYLVDWIEAGHVFVGQNIAYDWGVIAAKWPEFLPTIFELYTTNRVTDTSIRQELIDIAKGQYRGFTNSLTGKYIKIEYSLADLARRHLGQELDKDTWRLRYGELIDTPLAQWPDGAKEYPIADAKSTLGVYDAQEPDSNLLEDQYRQSRSAWALHLMSAWGLRTNEVLTNKLRIETEADLDACREMLLDAGLVVKNQKTGLYQKKVKKAKEYMLSVFPDGEKTPTGQPKLDKTNTEASGDELMIAFQKYSSSSTIIQRVEELEAGHDEPIHSRFEVLMETGRTSSSKPNVQNRSAKKPGDRECIEARPGKVFLVADYDGLELRTIAQSCLNIVGHSRMAEALNRGDDLHAEIAARLLSISVREVLERKKDPSDQEIYLARQTGKVANFGLNAGLGWKGLIGEARTKYSITLTEGEAKELIIIWRETWPEFNDFFAWVRAQTQQSGTMSFCHFGSNRWRGHIPYTVACNSPSQGLGADATKAALFALSRLCYDAEIDDILLGSRLVNYIHDEFIIEADDDDSAHDKAFRMTEIMTQEANKWLPDVKTTATPLLARRWSKLAKPVYKDGRLVPWEWDEVSKLSTSRRSAA